MSNSLITPTQVTREALRILHQQLNFVGNIERQYDKQYAKEGAKIGDTLKIRLPNQYTVRRGAALQTQDTTENTVDLKVQTQAGVDLNFTSVDLTLSLDDFSTRILEPAMSVLAANIEYDAMSMYKDVAQSVWNGGSANSLTQVNKGRAILQRALAPKIRRTANMNVQDMADIVGAGSTIFNPTSEISQQYKEGYVGRQGGFDYMENTLWPSHTRGAANTAYTTDTRTSALPTTTPNTPVSSITVASGSGAISKGDVFTIANVVAVHPETKASTGITMQFAAAADALTGATTLTFTPAIILSGPAQNCTIASTSATAAITWLGTLSVAVGTSLLYQKEAFAFATADMFMPKGVDFASRQVMDGISMRIVRQYDINSDKLPCRVDVLYGFKTLRPQLAVRLHNN